MLRRILLRFMLGLTLLGAPIALPALVAMLGARDAWATFKEFYQEMGATFIRGFL